MTLMNEQWNVFWHNDTPAIYKVGNAFFWQLFYEHFLDFIDVENPSILDLGGGLGGLSWRIAEKLGGKVTIVDFSEEAQNRSDEFFRNKRVKSRYIKSDIFSVELDERYDIVHSHGLIEHFFGEKRKDCFKKHIEFIKKGGFGIILAPAKCDFNRVFLKPLISVLGLDEVEEVPLDESDVNDFFQSNDTRLICRKQRFGWIGLLFGRK